MKHDRTGLNFPYSRKIDGHDHGAPNGDISLHLIIGAEDNYPTETELFTLSAAQYQLMIVVPRSNKLIEDAALFLKTNKYAQLNSSTQISSEKLAVITTKRGENEQRLKGVAALLSTLLNEARFFFNSRELPSQSNDFYVRLREAGQQLIDGSYIYLKKLSMVPKRDDIVKLLRDHTSESLIAEFGGFNDVENEVLAYTGNKAGDSGRVDLRTMIEHFRKIPYGYVDDLIIPHALVSLYIHNKVTIYYNVTELSATEILKRLDNSKEYSSVLVKPNEDISPELLQEARRFHFDWFGRQLQATDAKLMEQEMKEALGHEAQQLKNLLFRRDKYPFLHRMEHPLSMLEKAISFDKKRFFDYITGIAQPMMESKDELDRILQFMNGPNRELFDRIAEFIYSHRADLEQTDPDNKDTLLNHVNSSTPYLNTQYNLLNNALEDLKRLLERMISDLRSETLAMIEQHRNNLPLMAGYDQVPEDKRYILNGLLDMYMNRVNGASSIASLTVTRDSIASSIVREILQKIHELTPVQPPPPPPPVEPGERAEDEPVVPPPPPPPPPPVVVYYVKELLPVYDGTLIDSPLMVEKYLAELRDKMLSEIEKGNKLIP